MDKKQVRAILKTTAKSLGWSFRYKNKDETLRGIRTQKLLDWIIGTTYAQDRIWHGAEMEYATSNFIDLLNAFGVPNEGYRRSLRLEGPALENMIRQHVESSQ